MWKGFILKRTAELLNSFAPDHDILELNAKSGRKTFLTRELYTLKSEDYHQALMPISHESKRVQK